MKKSSLLFLPLLFLLQPLAAGSESALLNLPLPENGLRFTQTADLERQWPSAHGQAHVCLWKDDKFAPISITIDDNNAPDIPFWREASATYGWKFTWFVIVHPYMWDIYADQRGNNTSYFGTAEDFKVLHEEGHEIALHGNCKAMNELGAEDYALHADRSKAHLEGVIGQRILTYAYPCGKSGGSGGVSYRDIIAERMIAARGTAGGATSPVIVDYLSTNSMGGSIKPQFWGKMHQNRGNLRYSRYRGWAVFLFHKVHPEGATALFDRLKAEEDNYWIAPFSEVARYAQERESSSVDVTLVEPERIDFELSDRMDDALFDIPLTVKLRVDGWSTVKAAQGSELIPARLVEHEGATYALVDAVPDRGTVSVREH